MQIVFKGGCKNPIKDSNQHNVTEKRNWQAASLWLLSKHARWSQNKWVVGWINWKNRVKRRRGRSPTCALMCEQRAMGMQIQKLNLTVVLCYCKESNLPPNRIFNNAFKRSACAFPFKADKSSFTFGRTSLNPWQRDFISCASVFISL